MRHEARHRHSPRGVTPRFQVVTDRALKREQQRLTLLADQVVGEKPIAETRALRFDEHEACSGQAMRDLAPPTAPYFTDFSRTRPRRLGITPEDDAT